MHLLWEIIARKGSGTLWLAWGDIGTAAVALVLLWMAIRHKRRTR